MTPADLIARVRALLAAATPEPWEAEVQTRTWSVYTTADYQTTDPQDPPPDPLICENAVEDDAALIAAAPTALAALCDALEAAMGVVERVAAHETPYCGGDPPDCHLCGAVHPGHHDDCPWLAARRLTGRE